MDQNILTFFHSLLRYAVLLFVAAAGFIALSGWLRKQPILVYERMLAVIAMVLCHIQLAIGLGLYGMRYQAFAVMAPAHHRYWKVEHISMMIAAIALVTIGRMLSKRAKDEPAKQRHIAVFYLIALVLMLVAIPWPFTEVGRDLGWL